MQGQWTLEESKYSSTWREIEAVARTLCAVACKLSNQRVRWFSDNQNVVRIIQVGSRKQNLQSIALEILKLAMKHNIKLEPEWVPREANVLADYLSRIIDYDDWGLAQDVFSILDCRWGPHTIDRFANKHNTKLERFNSRFWEEGTEAVDAFTVDWKGDNNYFCPPVCLVPRVLHHARRCACVGTLVVPEWPSAVFWPLLCTVGGVFAQFVVDFMYLPLSPGLLTRGKRGACLFKDGLPNTNVMALRLDFSYC